MSYVEKTIPVPDRNNPMMPTTSGTPPVGSESTALSTVSRNSGGMMLSITWLRSSGLLASRFVTATTASSRIGNSDRNP